MEILEHQKAEEAKLYQQHKAEAEELKKKIEAVKLTFPVKTGKDGKLFGSISTSKIAEQLAKQYGFEVEKRKFVDNDNLTSLGHYDVKCELFKDVIATISVDLVEQ